jgi:hypothetical protein
MNGKFRRQHALYCAHRRDHQYLDRHAFPPIADAPQ